jgi:hypothetical protein
MLIENIVSIWTKDQDLSAGTYDANHFVDNFIQIIVGKVLENSGVEGKIEAACLEGQGQGIGTDGRNSEPEFTIKFLRKSQGDMGEVDRGHAGMSLSESNGIMGRAGAGFENLPIVYIGPETFEEGTSKLPDILAGEGFEGWSIPPNIRFGYGLF